MLPKISYHGGHTGELCAHAKDTKAELLSTYKQAGFTHVGITEHLPPFAGEDYFLYPDEKKLGLSAESLEVRFLDYFKQTVPSLKKTWEEQFQDLRFGFETEFYGEAPLRRIEKAIQQYTPELIVASLHHVRDIPIDYSQELYKKAALNAGSLDKLYEEYYQRQFELIEFLGGHTKNIPVVLGHMDLIRLHSPEHTPSKKVERLISKNIDAAIASDIAFEVNTRAFKKELREPYPAISLLKRMKERGGRLTLGDDSHAQEDVGLHYQRLETFWTQLDAELWVCKNTGDRYEWETLGKLA